MQSSRNKRLMYGRGMAAHLLCNALEGPAARAQNCRPFNIESNAGERMGSCVRSLGREFQILNSIVSLIFVFVVNFFAFTKFSSKMSFHYVAMNFHTLAVNIYASVTGATHWFILTRLIVTAKGRAEKATVPFSLAFSNIMPWALKSRTARGAHKIVRMRHEPFLPHLGRAV